nr:sialate O-acetylesterase [uncultured Pedobacter sp.]
MMKKLFVLACCCTIFLFQQAFADVKLPALFGNHMVLQQDTLVKLWGWANPNEKIEISASWQQQTIKISANAQGEWKTAIKTLKADLKSYSITFKASNQIKIDDILFGEVWLCGGQSNMSFPIKGTPGHYSGLKDVDEVLKTANHPKLRFITVERKVANEPQKDTKGEWMVCSPETAAGDISAVSYYFALQLIEKTGFPVGLIGANWGGTPAEAWTSKKVLENNPDFKPILEKYDQTVNDWANIGQAYRNEYKAYQFQDSVAKENHTQRPSRPAEPIGPNSNKSPYKLYNGIIKPLEPFTIKGVIWYQGENNATRAYQYKTLFPAMMRNWRNDLANPKLPFYFVQISPHRSQNPEIREAQRLAFLNDAFTGMVVTTDNGDSLDIHPRNKKLVGDRLSFWALKKQYGFNKIVASGPMYQSYKIEGNKIRLYFTDVADSLIAKDGILKEFTIAGADEKFYPAKAEIDGNTIVVESPKVISPKAVRFAWKNVPHPNLYNSAGLPTSPFKTDNWKWETQDVKN